MLVPNDVLMKLYCYPARNHIVMIAVHTIIILLFAALLFTTVINIVPGWIGGWYQLCLFRYFITTLITGQVFSWNSKRIPSELRGGLVTVKVGKRGEQKSSKQVECSFRYFQD